MISAACIGASGGNKRKPPKVVQEIVAEATKPQVVGDWPLPLYASWDADDDHGDVWLAWINAGYHCLPTFKFASPSNGGQFAMFSGWDTIAQWGLPFTMYQFQFESVLHWEYLTTQWSYLQPSLNPGLFHVAGYYTGTLASNAVVTTNGSKTVTVTLPDASTLTTAGYIWITESLIVGGLQMTGSRWKVTSVTGNDITFTHSGTANADASGGSVTFETALYQGKADPLGDVDQWGAAGAWWVETWGGAAPNNGWTNLQGRYPGPSKVILLSNNEAEKFSPATDTTWQRFVALYGTGKNDREVSEIMQKAYEPRFQALFSGLRTALEAVAPTWNHRATCVGYNAVIPFEYARYGGWLNDWRYFTDGMDYEKNFWEGASPEYYLNPVSIQSGKCDYLIWSPQTEFCNTAWILNELIYPTHSQFWYEMSVWDGHRTVSSGLQDAWNDRLVWYANKSIKSVYDTNILGASAVVPTAIGSTEFTIAITSNPSVQVGDLFVVGATGFTAGGIPWAAGDSWAITEIVSSTSIKLVRTTAASSTTPGGGQSYSLATPDLFTAERWKAFLRFGMWLTKPRVVREFRYLETAGEYGARQVAIMDAVEEVWDDPVKTRFWREGTIVANTTRTHPYRTSVAAECNSFNKWFVLECSANMALPTPDASMALGLEVHVWALALVIGTTPNREWLVYAYSPKQDRTGVTITVPGYGDVVVDVPQAGVFHYVAEV